MTDLDELDRIREQRTKADKLLLNLLQADYTQMQPYAITDACHYLQHPPRNPDKPDMPCRCGRRK